MLSPPPIRFEFAPWRLTGTVYGTLFNDPAALAAMGDAAHAPPYKAPPGAPVLYVKPRNTLACDGARIALAQDTPALEIGASLGIVIGRTACRVRAQDALQHVAGWTLVADLSVPHDSFYRPGVRFKALDGSCLIGPCIVPRDALAEPDALSLQVSVAGAEVRNFTTAGMLRPVAQLLQDVSAFMTLSAGDVLMLGVKAAAPLARAGDSFRIDCSRIGTLHGHLVTESQAVAA